jgi:O-glycosyl hydrolase
MKKTFLICIALWVAFSSPLSAQPEVMAWGNMTGIRIDGQLIDFESFLAVADKDGTKTEFTGKELQSPMYTRDGKSQTVTTAIDKIRFKQTITEKSKGIADIAIEVQADTTLETGGVYFRLLLPAKYYEEKTLEISDKRIFVKGDGQQLTLDFDKAVVAFEKKRPNPFAAFGGWGGFRIPNGPTDLYIEIAEKNVQKGQTASLHFTITAAGDIDTAPVDIVVDAKNPGREFLGLGGNFRLQNPQNDPKVIDYCLTNMRVAFGRVEMPWYSWQPDEKSDPLQEALNGHINPQVENAMKMAQRLKALGMPVIVSAWFPPAWATDPAYPRGFGGVAAQRLLIYKQEQIYKSIADYLVALKNIYGVEATAFSFNESDIGIDVYHTPEQHAYLIKTLGAYFASRGLATKLLLGDNSDATTFDFILPALNDPATYPYIYAVSFHSWRGCDDRTLNKWAWAARQINVPLIIGEGSTDAAAHRYSQIFAETTFALYEINLYTRICAICQPQSILQWQLTSDYSILWGDGIYNSTGTLRPTQRFWNLKQLAATPENSFAIPFTCSRDDVNPAVFGNIAKKQYVVHAVNNGAARSAVIKGLPVTKDAKVTVFVTNSRQDMEEVKNYKIVNNEITVNFPAVSFISIFIN